MFSSQFCALSIRAIICASFERITRLVFDFVRFPKTSLTCAHTLADVWVRLSSKESPMIDLLQHQSIRYVHALAGLIDLRQVKLSGLLGFPNAHPGHASFVHVCIHDNGCESNAASPWGICSYR